MSKQKPKSKLLKKISEFSLIAALVAIGGGGGGIAALIQGKSKKDQAAILVFIPLFGVMFFSMDAVLLHFKAKPLELHGQQIAGTIVSMRYVRGNSHIPIVTYEFTSANGQRIQNEGKSCEPIKPDRKIQVTYLPDDPTDNMLTEGVKRTGSDIQTDGYISFVFLSVAGLLRLATSGWRSRKSDKDVCGWVDIDPK